MKSILIIFFVCLFIGKSNGQPYEFAFKIDSLINTKYPRSFNGIVWITKNGKAIYSKTKGYSDFEKKTTFTLKDNFRIQSLSKQITAVIVLREVEKGRINLHAPISQYLPDLKQTWADTVTVHQLLNNTSGIVSIHKPLLFKPGTAYYYSNPGYGLVRPILEKVTGKTFIETANSLFKELKMDNSYCYDLDKPSNGLINGYWINRDSISVYDFKKLNYTIDTWQDFVPAGGMISNAIDLNLWERKLHNGKILKPESYKLMTSYEMAVDHEAFGKDKMGYGYGIRVSDNSQLFYLGHAGKGLGFTSLKFYIPSKDICVIVLQNVYDVNTSSHYYFESKIRDIILKSNLSK